MLVTKTCLYCRKNFLIKASRLGKFCSVNCSNEFRRQSKVELKCQICSKFFLVKPSRIEKRKTCSVECVRTQKTTKVARVCVLCGKNYLVVKSNAESKYCSPNCHHLDGRVKKECYCGRTFEVRKSRKNQNYCSRKCWTKRFWNEEKRVCLDCGEEKTFDELAKVLSKGQIRAKPRCIPCDYSHRRSRNLKTYFNFSESEYIVLRDAQKNRCAICKKLFTEKKSISDKISANVDHCHKTGKVRGLLCNNCNLSLGLLRDSPQILQNAIDYLKRG